MDNKIDGHEHTTSWQTKNRMSFQPPAIE